MGIEIIFAVGHENKIAVIHHPEGNFWNAAEIDLLYDEIEKGCPIIQKKELSQGIYRGEFSTSGLSDLWVIRHQWRKELACA